MKFHCNCLLEVDNKFYKRKDYSRYIKPNSSINFHCEFNQRTHSAKSKEYQFSINVKYFIFIIIFLQFPFIARQKMFLVKFFYSKQMHLEISINLYRFTTEYPPTHTQTYTHVSQDARKKLNILEKDKKINLNISHLGDY